MYQSVFTYFVIIFIAMHLSTIVIFKNSIKKTLIALYFLLFESGRHYLNAIDGFSFLSSVCRL